MGITIDEAIIALERDIHNARLSGHRIGQYEVAIDIMHKYQKIEEIVNDRYGKPVFKTLDEVIKVVEDGNVDN